MISKLVSWFGKHGSTTGALISCLAGIPSAVLCVDQLNGAKEERKKTEVAAERAADLLRQVSRIADAQDANLEVARVQATQMTRSADGALVAASSQAEQAALARQGIDVARDDLAQRGAQFTAAQNRQDEIDQPLVRVTTYEWMAFKVGSSPRLKIFINNDGRIPPTGLQLTTSHFVVTPIDKASFGPSCQSIESSKADIIEMGGSTSFSASRNAALTKEEVDSIESGERVYLINGRLCYRDGKGRPRETDFCIFRNRDITAMCAKGNTVLRQRWKD